MTGWEKINITTKAGVNVEAQAPIIISASRATDIPAFYSDWLKERIEYGYLKWKNPFNSMFSYVSFNKVRLFVFWSKNPRPLIKHLDFFDDNNYNYYFQYTLNDYDDENLEPKVPKLKPRLETFIKISEKIGKDKVIWRFDPLILTDKIGIEELLRKVENVGNILSDYTNKFVFSFADIKVYKKVQNNLRRYSIKYHEFSERQMNEFAAGLKDLNEKWKLEVGTCAEKIELSKYGIVHNKCIDDDLIIRLFNKDEELMKFLGVKIIPADMFNSESTMQKAKNNKDKGQREFCGCIYSKDIGEYDTCPHLCEYCYANSSKETVKTNFKLFSDNRNSETITGKE